jgi:SAM-dependent methyltransferase
MQAAATDRGARTGDLPHADSRPGNDRREPLRSDKNYLALAPLARDLREEIDGRLAGRTGLDVLDVGCGNQPYRPWLEAHLGRYVGLDIEPAAGVDVVGHIESLPFDDGSFDVVLCTQVLEHTDDPQQAVREIHRVLRSGGVALASTHGVFVFHPPSDLWRWTHEGLRRLFLQAGDWRELSVRPNGHYLACLGFLVAELIDGFSRWHKLAPRIRRVLVSAVNGTAERLDARYRGARVPEPGALSINYLVTGIRE